MSDKKKPKLNNPDAPPKAKKATAPVAPLKKVTLPGRERRTVSQSFRTTKEEDLILRQTAVGEGFDTMADFFRAKVGLD